MTSAFVCYMNNTFIFPGSGKHWRQWFILHSGANINFEPNTFFDLPSVSPLPVAHVWPHSTNTLFLVIFSLTPVRFICQICRSRQWWWRGVLIDREYRQSCYGTLCCACSGQWSWPIRAERAFPQWGWFHLVPVSTLPGKCMQKQIKLGESFHGKFMQFKRNWCWMLWHIDLPSCDLSPPRVVIVILVFMEWRCRVLRS